MIWQLGLARWAAVLNRDLQLAARLAGGGERLWAASVPRLERLLRIDPARISTLAALRRDFDSARELAGLHEQGIGFVPLGHDDYPVRLSHIVDPPFGLFTMRFDRIRDLPGGTPRVAVVGSRRPSAFGTDFARTLARDLASRGALVVSGLALGIDAAAHLGALDGDGGTVGVLGAGVDVVSPRRNASIRQGILNGGTLLSEYWPGTEPAPWRFPARNRIIAGLVDVVVVVEAGDRSGALITADFALEHGTPVVAVPGAPVAARSVGCNGLIRAGAGMCESVEDVIAECPDLEWRATTGPEPQRPTGVQGTIYDLLGCEPMSLDEIAERSGHDVATIAVALAGLELGGHVTRGHGQRYWVAALGRAA